MHRFEKKFRQEVLRCSRCGFCQAICPVFGVTLRPALNARGKMLLLLEAMEGKIALGDELIESIYQCTYCASCVQTCPSEVPLPEVIREVRKDLVEVGSGHPALKGLREILSRPANIYGESETRDFGRERNRKAQYVYFVGCVGSYREDEVTKAVLRLLDRLQVDYALIDEACCGGVLEDVGYEINGNLARGNIDRILATQAHTVITGCPYCFRTFTGHPSYSEFVTRGVTVLHLSHFLKDFDFGVTTLEKVTYHDPCDLGRHLGSYEAPRRIIRKIAPNFVEMAHHGADALCCGAGGGLRGAYAKNSIAMARRRLREVEAVGAEVILTDCNSCVHNFRNAKLGRQTFRIYHTTQFIEALLERRA